MANALYNAGRQAFLTGDIAWDTDDINITLCDETDYTVNLVTDDFYDDVTVAGRVADADMTTNVTQGAGIADANDVTFSSVSGDESESLTCYKVVGVGTAADDPLIFNIDTATGLPVTPNGGDIVVQWANTGNYIFKL